MALSDDNSLVAVAEGLLSYLNELNTYREVCLRHQATTAIDQQGDWLRVSRMFAFADSTAQAVRAHIGQMGGWEGTAHWLSEKKRWKQLMHEESIVKERIGQCAIVLRGIAWEGRPLLANARVAAGESLFRVDLSFPHVTEDLPELPLRIVTDMLRCHEHVVPGYVATPLPISAEPGRKIESIREYLTRAMPQNLCASQCISVAGAGKSPTAESGNRP